MKHHPPSKHVTVDLPDEPFNFPQQIVTTDSQPDIIVWDHECITLIELTVPFELCIESAVHRKRHRYSDLLDDCRAKGYSAMLLTLEVGSRGFLHCSSFDSLYKLVPSRRCHQEALETDIVRKCVQESYRIWCKRNWSED